MKLQSWFKGSRIRLVKTAVPISALDECAVKAWLKSRLSDERYFHSLGAQQKAEELARNYGFTLEDFQKASLAALLHDCAKLMTPAELVSHCETLDIFLTPVDLQSPQTLHPYVGAELVRLELDIDDQETLDAIRYHTTGRQGMSAVEKMVYIADKIEGNTRNPLYTQKIQALIDYKDKTTLDKAVLYILDSTITFLMEKGQLIHPRTVEARNDLVSRLKQAKTRHTQP